MQVRLEQKDQSVLPWVWENSPADWLWISSAVLTPPDWWPLNLNISSPCVSCTTGCRFYQPSYSRKQISYNKSLSIYIYIHKYICTQYIWFLICNINIIGSVSLENPLHTLTKNILFWKSHCEEYLSSGNLIWCQV